MFRNDEHHGAGLTAAEATDPLSRRALLASLTGASAAGAVAAIGSSVIGATPAAAAGTDRGMAYTVAASNAGAPFQNNADAQCDGTADEAEINAAIDALDALGGGTVELSDGTFNIAAPIVLKSRVTIRGQGSDATSIWRGGNFVIVRASGAAGAENHVRSCRIFDLTLHGQDFSATGLECFYSSLFLVQRVFFGGIFGHAIEGVELYDSTFTDCRFDYCGSRDGSNVPAVGLYQTRPSAPSDDNCNNCHFINCTWETHADGALWFVGGFPGAGEINNCHVVNAKLESSTVRGVPIKAEWCSNVTFHNVLVSLGAFENQTQPQDAFTITNSLNLVIESYYGFPIDWDGQSVRTFLSLKGGNHHIFLKDLLFLAASPNKPSVAALEFTGTNEVIDLGYHAYGYDESGSAVLRTGNTTKKYRNSGEAQIAVATTNVIVTHNLQKTPALADIAVTPNNNIGANRFWVSNVNATTFRINQNTAPTVAARFAWQAEAY